MTRPNLVWTLHGTRLEVERNGLIVARLWEDARCCPPNSWYVEYALPEIPSDSLRTTKAAVQNNAIDAVTKWFRDIGVEVDVGRGH